MQWRNGPSGKESSRISGKLSSPDESLICFHALFAVGKELLIELMHDRNAISENVEDKQSDLFEEIGVELDEGLAADFKSLEQLLPKKRRIV